MDKLASEPQSGVDGREYTIQSYAMSYRPGRRGKLKQLSWKNKIIGDLF